MYNTRSLSLWRAVFKTKKAAFLFSCLYIFSAYRTVDIYYRSAIAEAIAITLVIPVLFYAYQIISGKEEKYPSVKLALSMSLLVYSHVLSTLMSTALIIILFLFVWFLKVSRMQILLLYLKNYLVRQE